MAQQVVGDPGCTCENLALIFEDPSVCTVEIKSLTSLALRLDTPFNIVKQWKQDLRLEKLTYTDVVLELLMRWRMTKSNNATLGALYEAIPIDMKQVKNLLQEIIRKKATCWNNLDIDSQNVIMQTNAKFLGRNYTLSSIRNMMKTDEFQEILNKPEMNEYFTMSFNKKDWDLGHYQIPKPLPYYIHRKLTIKKKLNPAIFEHKCSDIFVIENIKYHHLSILAGTELTEVSSGQLSKVTRRFILMEDSDDFNEITKVAEHPVHRIKHEDNQFYWICTSGSCQIIRVFLMNEVEEIEEKTLVENHLSTFNNRPVAVCSSPGMGKSVLLANLAHEMTKTYPERIVIYLQLRLLIPMLSLIAPEFTAENIKQILVSCPSLTSIGKDILLDFLNNEDLIFEVVLDGFDEISLEYLEQTKRFLKRLFGFPNMRVYVTSRPHMQTEMENTLKVISYNIAPFNQENQIKFLCDFWTFNWKVSNCEKLSQFAMTVLKSLEFINQGITSQTEFAGIPLQCFMLAKIYASQAKRFYKRDHFNFQATNSLYELYDEFMTLKFKNIKESERRLIKMYHWKETLTLLFPGNTEAAQIIQELTKNVGTDEVPWGKIFSVGILELTHDKINFVHRTFAEYLLAEFIVAELFIKEIVDMNISVKFFIDSVLLVHVTTRGHILTEGEIKLVCNFIKSSESWLTGKLNPKNLKAVLVSQCVIPFEAVEDDLFQILYNWLTQMGSNASVDILDRSLEVLGCSQLVDDLHKNVFQRIRVLQHEMVCTFGEAALKKHEKILARKNLEHYEPNHACVTHDWNHLKWKLLICTEHGYQFLTQTIVKFYQGTSILNKVLSMENKVCNELLLSALCIDNVEFFMYICDTVKSSLGYSLQDFFKTFTLKELKYDRTPLLESIRRGNYKLVEYLVKFIGDDIKDINDLWLACFIDSWKDSPIVVQNKVNILELLRPLNQNFEIEKLKTNFTDGVNVVLLTSQYDLYGYVPCEKDVNYMARSTRFCCRNDAEIDNLVNWLLSKNLAHLLTYKYRLDFCLLYQTLLANVMKPETLTMLYGKYRFDLGIIFRSAILCKRSEAIVETVIKLSGDVNFVDISQNTLLHWAAVYLNFDAIRNLISFGANVNSRNALGNTPLYNVFQNIDSSENFHSIHDIVCLLLNSKADARAKNIAGISALELAKARKDDMCIEEKTIELLKIAANIKITQSLEVFNNSTNIVKILDCRSFALICFDATLCKRFLTFAKNVVGISGNVNISDSHNSTLLHYAALQGESKAMEYLLSHGADANIKDNDGDTPFQYLFDWILRKKRRALDSFNTNTNWIHGCVELLLKYNADVNVKRNNGETCLGWIKKQKDYLEIEDRTISLLVQASQHKNEVGKRKRLL